VCQIFFCHLRQYVLLHMRADFRFIVLLPISIEYLNTQINSLAINSCVRSPCFPSFILDHCWILVLVVYQISLSNACDILNESELMSSKRTKFIKIWPCSSHLLLRNDYFIFSEYFWAKLSRLITHSVSSSKSTIWLTYIELLISNPKGPKWFSPANFNI
jgi:hypothetical protein